MYNRHGMAENTSDLLWIDWWNILLKCPWTIPMTSRKALKQVRDTLDGARFALQFIPDIKLSRLKYWFLFVVNWNDVKIKPLSPARMG